MGPFCLCGLGIAMARIATGHRQERQCQAKRSPGGQTEVATLSDARACRLLTEGSLGEGGDERTLSHSGQTIVRQT
jgi:hypothetical protein